MMQLSVYTRVCNGMDSVETHKRRVKNAMPEKGSVRLLVLTEKQYESIEILLGEKKFDDTQTIKDTISVF